MSREQLTEEAIKANNELINQFKNFKKETLKTSFNIPRHGTTISDEWRVKNNSNVIEMESIIRKDKKLAWCAYLRFTIDNPHFRFILTTIVTQKDQTFLDRIFKNAVNFMRQHFISSTMHTITEEPRQLSAEEKKAHDKAIKKNKKDLSEIQSVIDRTMNLVKLLHDFLKSIDALSISLRTVTATPTTKAEKKACRKIENTDIEIRKNFREHAEKIRTLMPDLNKWLISHPNNTHLIKARNNFRIALSALEAGMRRINRQFELRQINAKADEILKKVSSPLRNTLPQHLGQGAQTTESNRHQLQFTSHRDGRVTGYHGALFTLPSAVQVVSAEAIETEKNLHAYHMRLVFK